MNKIEKHGLEQYSTFVKERLVERVKPLDDSIKKNMLHLFSTPKRRQKTKAQEVMAEIKSDSNLFSRLYVASQVRDGNLEENLDWAQNLILSTVLKIQLKRTQVWLLLMSSF